MSERVSTAIPTESRLRKADYCATLLSQRKLQCQGSKIQAGLSQRVPPFVVRHLFAPLYHSETQCCLVDA